MTTRNKIFLFTLMGLVVYSCSSSVDLEQLIGDYCFNEGR
jgi:hypothetical protein